MANGIPSRKTLRRRSERWNRRKKVTLKNCAKIPPLHAFDEEMIEKIFKEDYHENDKETIVRCVGGCNGAVSNNSCNGHKCYGSFQYGISFYKPWVVTGVGTN